MKKISGRRPDFMKYVYKVIDKETAKIFVRLVELILTDIDVEADIPEDDRMTSLITVTLNNYCVKEFEKLSFIVDVTHAKPVL